MRRPEGAGNRSIPISRRLCSAADAKIKMTDWPEAKFVGRPKTFPPARLGVPASRPLGRAADPDGPLRGLWLVLVPDTQLPVLLPDVDCTNLPDISEPLPLEDPRLAETECLEVRRNGRTRDGYHAQLGRFHVVFPPLCRSAQRHGLASSPEALKYWMPVNSHNGGMETRPCTCCIAVLAQGDDPAIPR